MEQLEEDRAEFCKDCAREMAARLLRLVIRRTPVGDKPEFLDSKAAPKTQKVKGASGKSRSFLTREGEILERYWSGYRGGTLRRGWTSQTEEEAEKGGAVQDVQKYAAGMRVSKRGGTYEVTVYNPVRYASYVEYGHTQTPNRYVPALGKRLKVSWVPGKMMMTKSAAEVQAAASKILEKKLKVWLENGINDR